MYSVCFPDFEKIKVLAVVPYLKKIKVGLWDLFFVCLFFKDMNTSAR
jgi:hypothetical protein